ncbi:MAG TPA: protease pro-enzyme activation domain-containing protein [Acidobacteriaceae bacterium]|jgi:hypothetical protein|nr:protease pro-enzyme activation domain-containing protein [Acidobacteriaceae bacterium]
MIISSHRLLLFAAIAACALPLAGRSQSAPPAAVIPSRIVAPVDDANRVSLRGNVHPLAQARFDRGPAPASTLTGPIALILQRSPAQQQALRQYLEDLQNPSSPNFHKWLTPAQYGAQFGISDADLQTVESWLQSYGFKIESVPAARNFIRFSGTFQQVQSAFHTAMHTYAVLGQTHFANATDPQIPAALAPVIAGVGPLHDFRPHSNLSRGVTGRWDSFSRSIQPSFTWFDGATPYLFADPADAAMIYDTPNSKLNTNYSGTQTWDGTGITIGIAGDSNISPQDVTNYRTGFLGETTANLPSVILAGNDPGLNGDEGEALLDIEIAGGLAPGAHINFYTGADTVLSAGLFNAIDAAIQANTVSILNISFGECEASAGNAGNQSFLEEFQQAAAQGISVTVSAGDGGSAGCDNFDVESAATEGLAVNGIASTPYTIAVGGTDFDGLPEGFGNYVQQVNYGTPPYYRTANGYIPENPWNDSTTVNNTLDNNSPNAASGATNIVAGGGGVSSCSTQDGSGACTSGYAKPSFQTTLTPSDGVRDLPDVALLAANGMYRVAWVLCADSVADGYSGASFIDCENTNGVFASGTNFDGVGGTSAAAPAFAGILALVSQSQSGARLGQADDILYQLAQSKYSTVFHDVATGNNSVFCAGGSPGCGANSFMTGYNAGTGYDLASGLGSVDANALVTYWSNKPLTATTTTFRINSSASALTALHGSTLNFSVGVTPSTATGAAAISGNGSGQFSIPLTNGSGAGTYNGLPGGSYTVTARYGGDSSDASSTSNAVSVDITPEASATAASVTAFGYEGPSVPFTNLAAIPYGSYVFLNALIEGKVEGASTQGVATGTVAFSDSGATLGTASVGGGNQASYPPDNSSYAPFALGTHTITAKYSGDASYNASTSTSAAFTVVKAPTATSVSADPLTVNAANSSFVNVTMNTPYNLGVAPTGSIKLASGGTTLATITNVSLATQPSGSSYIYVLTGASLIQGSQLAPGANTVTATYTGDTYYASSTATFTLTNTSGVGAFTLGNSGDVTVTPGRSANDTISITPSGGFDGPVTLACSVAASLGGACSVNTPVNVSGSAISILVSVTTPVTATTGAYPVTVKGVDNTGKTTASTSFNIIVTSVPSNAGVALANSGPLTVTGGATYNNTTALTLTPINGYTGEATIACTVTTTMANPVSLPTCASPAVTVSSTTSVPFFLQFTTTATTSAGAYTVNVTATDQSSASITASTTFALNVVAPPVIPAIAVTSGGNITVSPGATSGNTSTITITPSGGYTGAIALTCKLTTQPSGASTLPACAIPATVSVTGTSAVTATLTITTNGGTSSTATPPLNKLFLGGGAALAMGLLFGIPARRRAWRTLLGLLVVVITMAGVGCGGGSTSSRTTNPTGPSGPSTTAGTYVFTVNALDAATELIGSSTTVTVTVN